jgi:UDP-N-acetyl-D-mannosaminuronate dehydrogenase
MTESEKRGTNSEIIGKEVQDLDVTGRRSDRSTEMLDTLRQVLALIISSYPVLMPLLEQFREEFRDGIDQVTEVLPRIAQVLGEAEVSPGTTDKLAHQLTEALPDLEKYFQKAEN